MPPQNWLNPSAGDVPIPSNPREVDAAIRAGRVSWRLVPYYGWRFGERGALFAKSDSAWLVTLSRHSLSHVHDQVSWLGGVLSNRGMPQWLLEIHLNVLHRELMRTLPENAHDYEKLLTASCALGNARRQSVPDEKFEELSQGFASKLGFPSNRWVRGTGRLLVAAVADENAGMRHAVEKLESWLIDPARFDEARRNLFFPNLRELALVLTQDRWTAAIRQTIAEARAG